MNDVSLAIIFITLNEEYHIGGAIDNVKDIASEIIVVDSGSIDKTVEIAETKGAKVVYHKFENFGAQWNFALSIPTKSKWSMKMDPDERLSDELKREIVVGTRSAVVDVCGFSFDRVLWFMGKRLCGVRNEVVRIWRTGHCRFSKVGVNEHPIVDGKVVKLHSTMEHYDSRDLSHWFDKQNIYTSTEALMRFRGDALSAVPRLFGNKLERRMWLKKCFYVMPFRYLILDVILFVCNGAWRSGVAGWRWVKCREIVMRMREYKYIEMMHEAKKKGKMSDRARRI